MAASSSSSSPTMPESVCEGLEFFEANNILIKALLEETQEDQYCEEDRLMNMIQSLEAEISSTSSSAAPYQSCDIEVGQVEGQDCSTSLISSWEDIEVVSARSPSSSSIIFDEEMMDAWSLCAAEGDNSVHYCSSDEFYYGVLSENYLPLEASDVVF